MAAFRIGTRGSPLALAQARLAQLRLAARHPALAEAGAVEIVPIRTSGDRMSAANIADAGGKGLFTREIEDALLAGTVDIAVHSMKDMPAKLPDGLTIAALLPPALISVSGDRDMAKVSTVDQAYSWILQNIPAGASIVLERRAMLLPSQYRVTYITQLRRKSYDELRTEGAQYLVANSESYGPALVAPHQYPDDYNDYMRIFTQSHEIQKITPTADVPGPELRIFKIVP